VHIFNRSVNDTILIGKDVRVTVVRVRGERVRLRIEAPQEIAVYRAEIIEQLREAAERALAPFD
jgi:carbon storage regulator